MSKSGSKSGAGRRPQAPKRPDRRDRSTRGNQWRGPIDDSFTCGHCHRFVGSLPSGGHHRNHCPYCLYSRHVDAERSGDRASPCGGMMAPIGAFQRPNGEHVLVHRCERCGFERFNRLGADDDFELVLSLPVVPLRTARPVDAEPARSDDTPE
ncbi:MAG TPA: RNHCP domain-containing protein [Ktedonobacterales bacterium]